MLERTQSLAEMVAVSVPFAPVHLAPVEVNGTSVSQVGVEIKRDDGHWECISIHSQGYQLIPNTLVQQTAREITSLSALRWREERRIWTGRFLSLMYRSDRLVEIPEVGDAVALGLRVENSYDGSARFRLVLMAFVLSCLNGLMVPRYFSTYTVKHIASSGFDIKEAVSVIQNGAAMLEEIAPRIAALSKIPLDLPLLAQVANRVDLQNRDWVPVIQHLGDAHTVWDLMQQITHRLTFSDRGRAMISASEQVGDYFLGSLVDQLAS